MPTLILTAVLSSLSGALGCLCLMMLFLRLVSLFSLTNPGKGLVQCLVMVQTGSRWEKSRPRCSAALQHLGSLGDLWMEKLLKFSRGQDFHGDRN